MPANRMVLGLVLATVAGAEVPVNQDRSVPVGVSGRIQGIILPGSELQVIPLTDYRTPIVLRIEKSYVHGDRFRYDLVYYGLDPGKFDLRDYLQRIDGSSADNLPSISVEIASVLPPGQVRPNELESQPGPSVGGYRLTLWLLGILWFLGLLVICFWGRGKKSGAAADGSRPITLADQLRPLVVAARKGELPKKDQAELERLLLVFWHDKLDVSGLPPSKAIEKLRSDPVAGRLLEALEAWLHRPEAASHDVDVAGLLEPYQNVEAVR